MASRTTADRASAGRTFVQPKVPEVFAIFWVVKLLSTGIGEASSDWMGNTDVAMAAVVGVGGFAAALWWQMRASSYHPVRYWLAVLMVAVFGTMIADGPHVALGSPYWADALVYLVLLLLLLRWWHRSEGTLSVHSITTSRRERFYWGTVLLTFGLGTATGDTAATDLHLGFLGSIVAFAILILVPLALWRLGVDGVFCFWFAYVLTRPLGASVADYLAAHRDGLGWGPGAVSAVGLALFVCFVAYLARTHHDEEGHHASAAREADHERRPGPVGIGDLDVTSE